MRRFVSIALSCLLLLGGCTSAAPQNAPIGAGGEVSILFATDLHYLAPSLFSEDSGFVELMQGADGKLTHHAPEITSAFIAEVLRRAPDALVLGGDLTFNGERQSHEELAALLRPVHEAGIPVLVIPGNHDINQPDAYRFTADGVQEVESVSASQFWQLYAPLGAEGASSRDEASLSYTYRVAEDFWLLMVDTSAYEEGRVREGGRVKVDTLAWMETELAAAQTAGAEVAVVMHHNLLVHNPMFDAGFAIGNDGGVVELLERYGVRLALSGHMHVQHVAQNGEAGVQDIATGSLSVWPHYYAEMELDAQRGLQYTARVLDVATWASGAGVPEQDLLDFDAYSRRFFDGCTAASFASALDGVPVSAEQKREMLALATELNADFFAGRQTARSPQDAAFLLWEEHCPTSFVTYYLRSILWQPRDSRVLSLPAR